MSSFFFACCFTNALCNNTLHLLYFEEFIKKEPLNGLFILSIFLTLNLPQLKLECLNCQKSDIRTNSPWCSVLHWTSFCFLQIILVETIPHCFWSRRGRQMPNTEQLLYQTEKSSHWRFSIKIPFLKIFQYSQENTYVKFLRTPILKNICIRLLLNWLYEMIVWKFVFGSHLKPAWLSNITKIPVAFKPKL